MASLFNKKIVLSKIMGLFVANSFIGKWIINVRNGRSHVTIALNYCEELKVCCVVINDKSPKLYNQQAKFI